MSWRRCERPDRKKWAVLRLKVFDRDGWKCRRCGRYKARLECDHVKSMEEGGPVLDIRNLQTLCRNCHISKSRRERQAKQPDPAVKGWRDFIEQRLECAR